MELRTLLVSAVVAFSALGACHSPSAAGGPTPATSSAGAVAPAGGTSGGSTPGASEVRARVGANPGGVGEGTPLSPSAGHALAAFAGGCFWGVEDGFRKVPGVTATAVGYTGGHTSRPTYATVCEHDTGHAETVLVEFDPSKLAYEKLLRIFFAMHDPTQLDRQGPDYGDQYRSAIFTWTPDQEKIARATVDAENGKRGGKIVTRVSPLGAFWKAEEYHQQYAEKTGHHGCPTGRIDDLL